MNDMEWMQELTARIRALVQRGDMRQAESVAAQAMARAPREAQPHNLMGIILESEHDHVHAMNHFRAAWALNPAFIPARVNMERYGSFDGQRPRPAYDEADCAAAMAGINSGCRIEYDARGVGRMARRARG